MLKLHHGEHSWSKHSCLSISISFIIPVTIILTQTLSNSTILNLNQFSPIIIFIYGVLLNTMHYQQNKTQPNAIQSISKQLQLLYCNVTSPGHAFLNKMPWFQNVCGPNLPVEMFYYNLYIWLGWTGGRRPFKIKQCNSTLKVRSSIKLYQTILYNYGIIKCTLKITVN